MSGELVIINKNHKRFELNFNNMVLTVYSTHKQWNILLKVDECGNMLYRNPKEGSLYKPEKEGNFSISIKQAYDNWAAEQILLGDNDES